MRRWIPTAKRTFVAMVSYRGDGSPCRVLSVSAPSGQTAGRWVRGAECGKECLCLCLNLFLESNACCPAMGVRSGRGGAMQVYVSCLHSIRREISSTGRSIDGGCLLQLLGQEGQQRNGCARYWERERERARREGECRICLALRKNRHINLSAALESKSLWLGFAGGGGWMYQPSHQNSRLLRSVARVNSRHASDVTRGASAAGTGIAAAAGPGFKPLPLSLISREEIGLPRVGPAARC